jgi:hypothetical protein
MFKYQVINKNTKKGLKVLSLSTKVELSAKEKREYLWQYALDNQININMLDLITIKL